MGTTSMPIGNRIIELRKKNGITQAELAELSDISIRTIQRIESKKVSPYDDTLKKIAKALSVEISDLKESEIPLKKLMLIHLSPLTGFLIPLFQIFAPFLLGLFYRTDYNGIDIHMKDIITFHLVTTLSFVLGLILIYFGFTGGYFLAIGTIAFCTFVTFWNTYRLSENKSYIYFNALELKK